MSGHSKRLAAFLLTVVLLACGGGETANNASPASSIDDGVAPTVAPYSPSTTGEQPTTTSIAPASTTPAELATSTDLTHDDKRFLDELIPSCLDSSLVEESPRTGQPGSPEIMQDGVGPWMSEWASIGSYRAEFRGGTSAMRSEFAPAQRASRHAMLGELDRSQWITHDDHVIARGPTDSTWYEPWELTFVPWLFTEAGHLARFAELLQPTLEPSGWVMHNGREGASYQSNGPDAAEALQARRVDLEIFIDPDGLVTYLRGEIDEMQWRWELCDLGADITIEIPEDVVILEP